jgi:hypothetical protein
VKQLLCFLIWTSKRTEKGRVSHKNTPTWDAITCKNMQDNTIIACWGWISNKIDHLHREAIQMATQIIILNSNRVELKRMKEKSKELNQLPRSIKSISSDGQTVRPDRAKIVRSLASWAARPPHGNIYYFLWLLRL